MTKLNQHLIKYTKGGAGMRCKCGCNTEAGWIIKSYDFNPLNPDKEGHYYEEPVCKAAKEYLLANIYELGLTYRVVRIIQSFFW